MLSSRNIPKGSRILHAKTLLAVVCCLILFFTLGSSPTPLNHAKADFSNSVHRPAYLPIEWHYLPNGGLKSDSISTMSLLGPILYIGGQFHALADGSITDVGNIISFDTQKGAWEALPNQGLKGWVRTLAIHEDDLYVGGYITMTGDESLKNLGYIARYDTKNNQWHALSNEGLSDPVNKIVVLGDNLYVGGRFTRSGDYTVKDLNKIARYNLTNNTWHALANEGLYSAVNDMQVIGDDLYVGGDFYETADRIIKDLGRIARYDTKSNKWYQLPHKGLNNNIYALAAVGNDLYVGGTFDATGNGAITDLDGFARYELSINNWNDLPMPGFNSGITELAASGEDLYVGGFFTQSADGSVMDLGNIARYNTISNKLFALPNQGLKGSQPDVVHSITVQDDDLYVGGRFDSTGDEKYLELDDIVRCSLDTYIFKGYLPVVLKR